MLVEPTYVKLDNNQRYQMILLRTIIDLPDSQIKALAQLAEQEGLSRAELIRRAVAAYLKHRGIPGNSAFGLWGDRGSDALEYEDRIRGEWER